MITTDNGVTNDTDGSLDMNGAAEAFLSRFSDEGDDDANKKKPSSEEEDNSEEEQEQQTTDNDDDSGESDNDSPDDEEDGEGSEDDKQPKKEYVEKDDVFLKIKVGEEEHEVPVKDLKRLFGQEAALTKKSQEVAALRKRADEETAKAVLTLNTLLARAKQKADPYHKINWAVDTRNLTPEEVEALQNNARFAVEEERFLEQELAGVMQAVQVAQNNERVAEAQATLKAFADPADPNYIEGWDKKVYQDTINFAVSEGLDKGLAYNLTNASALRLLWMASQYKKGASKVQVQKKNKTPKRIVKSSDSPVERKSESQTKQQKAMKNLKATGSLDAAADAFLSRMAKPSDE